MHDLEPEFFVTLEISANTVAPAELKRRFHIESAFTSDNAAARVGVPPSQIAPFWILDTRGKVNSSRLVDHLRWVADRLAGNETLEWARQHESVHLYANGPPHKWQRDHDADERERDRLGVPVSFAVTVQTSNRVHIQTPEDRERAD